MIKLSSLFARRGLPHIGIKYSFSRPEKPGFRMAINLPKILGSLHKKKLKTEMQ
jgi:hypothetical protein